MQSDTQAGLLLRVDSHGVHRLEPGARRAHCALPARGPAWQWQRFLVAQLLPFAALLQGLEVLHAGAVELGGGAVAVTAPSRGGKSTLLAALVARGAPLVADDVVAAERRGEEVVVHPGPGVLSLRDDAPAVLGQDAAALGRPDRRLGPWRAVPRAEGVLPLRALCVLQRDPRATRLEVRRQDVRGPELLGATFISAWQERDRLVRQLDVTAAIARNAVVLRLVAPPDVAPRELAAVLEEAVS